MKKILATLGPTSLNENVIQKIEKDVSLFRINLSHTPLDLVEETILKIRSFTDVPICLDSEGAQLRNRNMKGGSVFFDKGKQVTISFDAIVGDEENISFSPLGIVKEFQVGDEIRVDFDGASFKVMSIEADHCVALVAESGQVGSNKAADINRDIPLPAITEKDRGAIEIGRKFGVKDFALSFAASADGVRLMRDLCGDGAKIMSKIESLSALKNLKEIIRESDSILIDRGDLSRQVQLEKIPFMQRRIIAMASAMGTPVFVATNLLESMIVSAAPTRAELNDVVSTLLMGASGLVLAAETAIGQYPDKAVRTIRALMDMTEKWTDHSTIDDIQEF